MIHLRPLFDKTTVDLMVKVSGSPALRDLPLNWKPYFVVDDAADEEGKLWRAASELADEVQRSALARCLILLRNACAQPNALKPPLNDKNCHEFVSGKYRNSPYIVYEISSGRIRLPWFYGIDRRTLIVSHCFLKKTQKAPAAEQGIAATLFENYWDAHGAAPQELRFHGD